MRYAFAAFEVDDDLFELRRDGEKVALRPQVLDLLLYLIRNQDQVVTKADLLAALRPGAKVSSSSLPHTILSVRRALDDEGEHIIQTVRGRGYRFVLPEAKPTPRGTPEDTVALFVGQESALARLEALFDRAIEGHGGVAMICGGGGSGKTQTANELARRARTRGALVVSGRSEGDSSAPDLWPWIQAVREYVHVDADARAAVLARDDLAALLPELARTEREPAPQDRFRMFDAVAELFGEGSRVKPIVILLDDVDAGDAASLLLLKFAGRALGASRALVVATYREASIAKNAVLARTLDALTREDSSRSISLEPFSRADVNRLGAAILGAAPTDDAIRRVHEKTRGNPLLVTQMLHLMRAGPTSGASSEGSTAALLSADGMREAISMHLGDLSPACVQAMSAASVFGGEFTVAALVLASGTSAHDLLAAIDEALRGRVVAKTGAPGAFRFVHRLVRDVLYKGLKLTARAALHEKAGVAFASAKAYEEAVTHLELAAHLLGVAIEGAADAPPEDRIEALLVGIRPPI